MPRELTIVGIGMIGASFALTMRGSFDRISVLDPDAAHVEFALGAGIADVRVTEVPDSADAILLSCPSDLIAGWVVKLAQHSGTVFDAGSVKGSIIREVEAELGSLPTNYVPSHPIAGLEQSGPQSADAGLYQGRTVILTPLATTAENHQAEVARLWQLAGARVEDMDPARHDQVYARTSHLPHLLAFAYLLGIEDEDLAHTGGGFRDFSRIGGSDPDMWTGIFDRNQTELLAALDQFEGQLADFRTAIERGDLTRCRLLIEQARARRAIQP